MTTSAQKHPQPAWNQVESLFTGIFDRQYYTENGPLVQQLEQELKERLRFEHVVCVCNEFVAYAELLNLLDPQGEVLLCGAHTATARQAIGWFKNQVAVLPESSTAAAILEKVSGSTAAVVLTGDCVDEALILQLREKSRAPGLRIIADVTHKPLQKAGGADAHVCAMSGNVPLSAVQGAYVATRQSELAHALRSMRSSSGVTQSVTVPRTVNGRLSEAHAGWALLNLTGRLSPT